MSNGPPTNSTTDTTAGTAVPAAPASSETTEATRFIQALSTNPTILIGYNAELLNNYITNPDAVTQFIQGEGYNTTAQAALAQSNAAEIAVQAANVTQKIMDQAF